MCTNGVNTSQLDANLEQIDELVALCRRWTHRNYHLADDASMERTAKALKEAQAGLDDVRAALDDARRAVERDGSDASGVSVNLA